MFTENANRSHGNGALNLSSFEPYAKNPPISKVFREISLADELGSGMRNTYKYTKLYSGGEPEFIEGDVFRTIVPLNDVSVGVVGPNENRTDLVTDQDSDQDGDQDLVARILSFCVIERSKKEICKHFGYGNLTYFTRKYLTPLIESGQLKMTIPDKPSSKNQKYIKA